MMTPHPIMAKYYLLVPLAEGIFEGMPLMERAVFGALWERYKLSAYKTMGGCMDWVDKQDGSIFCVYTHDELARVIGASEKTIRRSLVALRDEHFIDWRKASYKGACRYYIEAGVCEYMARQKHDNTTVSDCP